MSWKRPAHAGLFLGSWAIFAQPGEDFRLAKTGVTRQQELVGLLAGRAAPWASATRTIAARRSLRKFTVHNKRPAFRRSFRCFLCLLRCRNPLCSSFLQR